LSSGFPLVFQMANGSDFDTTPGYYTCAMTPSGTGDQVVSQPAGVWSNNHAILQSSHFVILTDSMDVYLWGNGTDYPVLIALWAGECNASVQGSDLGPDTEIDISAQVSTTSRSINVTMNITCSFNCNFQLNSSVWYVCAWNVYYGNVGVFFFYPEAAVTNFTVTSGTTGWCPTPVFTTVPIDVPFDAEIDIVAFDGSFDTSICSSEATCDTQWTFWNVVASSWGPMVFPCITNNLPYDFTLTATVPFQSQMTLSKNVLNYDNTPTAYNASFSADQKTLTLTSICINDGLGDITTVSLVVSAYEETTLDTYFDLLVVSLTQVNIFVDSVTPNSGPPSTPVRVNGTFWPAHKHECTFGGTVVTATNVTSSQLTCAAPTSSDESNSFTVIENGVTITDQNKILWFDIIGGTTGRPVVPSTGALSYNSYAITISASTLLLLCSI